MVMLLAADAAEAASLINVKTAMEAPTRQELDLRFYAEEPESWAEFFRHRIQLGAGLDEEYNDNILLEDNKKRDEWISTLGGLFLFNDSRGSVLYGTQYEVNAYRHHRSDNNALDHDFLAYLDFDPGGRVQFHAEYGLETKHYLVFGDEKIDILRRNNDFQDLVITTWRGRAKYALNDTNSLVPQLTYALLDDHNDNDRDSDRKRLDLFLDMDHDLTPTWAVFGGYALTDTTLPKNRLKSSQSNGGRVGVRHALTEIADLTLILTLQETQFEDGADTTDRGISGEWAYQAGPRTRIELGYSDTQGTSFSTARRQFRGRSPSLNLTYEWTPLVDVTASAGYTLQTSGSQQVTSGSPIHAETQKSYALGLGLGWHITPQGQITIGYHYTRSTSRDTTRQRVALGFETSF